MNRAGKCKNRRSGSLLLLILFGLGLALLALPDDAESGVATAWVRRYYAGGSIYGGPSGAKAIALDVLGNVYVTGNSSSLTGYKYTTIKYNPRGQRLWLRCYDVGEYRDAQPNAIAVDGQGNAHVTGGAWKVYYHDGQYDSVCATVKYDADGHRVWARRIDCPRTNPYEDDSWDEPNAIAVDSQGNVYITGYLYWHSTTIKYNPDGRQIWRRYSNGEGKAMALDSQGNIYITGAGYSAATGFDYVTIKYSPNGQQLWERRYNGPANSDDYATAIAVDAQGNVYVTGESKGSGDKWNDSDYATIKYSPGGEELWVRRYDGPAKGGDWATAIAVDAQGNVYVTGGSNPSGDEYWDSDYATIKYSPDGEELWVRRYDGPASGYDWATAMALDGQGNIYVTGTSSSDYATIKYSPDGQQLWLIRYNGPGKRDNNAAAIAVDCRGNVFVTGTSTDEYYGLTGEYVTIKYMQTPRTGR